MAALAAVTLPEFSIASHEVGWVDPGAQEVGAEAEDEIGLSDVEVRKRDLVVHALDRFAKDRILDGLESQQAGAVTVGEPPDNLGQLTADGTRRK